MGDATGLLGGIRALQLPAEQRHTQRAQSERHKDQGESRNLEQDRDKYESHWIDHDYFPLLAPPDGSGASAEGQHADTWALADVMGVTEGSI